MRGRKPKPTALKRLDGNPGKKKLPESEPQPSGSLPEAPPHLTDAERKIWTSLGRELRNAGIATSLDASAFEMLVAAYSAYLSASAKVVEFGPVWIEKKDGSDIPRFAYSPYWAIANKEWKKVLTLLAEFGMTPSSRARVATNGAAIHPTDDDKFFGVVG